MWDCFERYSGSSREHDWISSFDNCFGKHLRFEGEVQTYIIYNKTQTCIIYNKKSQWLNLIIHLTILTL